MGGLARPDLSFDSRVVRRSEPDPDYVVVSSGKEFPFLRSRLWYHVLEIGWDRPVIAYEQSQIFSSSESEGADYEKRVLICLPYRVGRS